MHAQTRRTFLKTSALTLAPLVLPSTVLGRDGVAPNSKITLGGIGIAHRGEYVLDRMLIQPDVHFLAVSDGRADRRKAIKEKADRRYNSTDCATYRDFRELLERKDIDTVLIATGDHWHAHTSIYAARAGKDVYSEKPCALTMELCGKLAETMRRYGTVFQGGTQRRSLANFRLAAELARSGKLGNIHTVHASIYFLRCRYDWYPAQPLPDREEIDWDMWLGPAPWRPYNRAYVMGDWRGHYDFDSGATHHDWGAHTVDLCQWALDADGDGPTQYWAEGNVCHATYKNGIKLVMRPDGWMGLGTCPVRFEGDAGWVETGDSGRMVVSPDSLRNELLTESLAGTDPLTHVRNFFDCVKTRRQPVCNADVIASSHLVCHASALSWMLKRELTYDPVKVEFADDEANRMRTREWREPWSI
ncbi:MAG: Gfo/Idh/MocA family oxidoreductase [Planctomycetaceae bacterium]|nr:Gfo/Idh/MocA family oxidoreductase [Planctomycetaceae bacterium]